MSEKYYGGYVAEVLKSKPVHQLDTNSAYPRDATEISRLKSDEIKRQLNLKFGKGHIAE